MSHESVVVVGDRFETFLANPGTIPASTLLWRLQNRGGAAPLSVVVGQGLTAEQLSALREHLGAHPGAGAVGGVPSFVEQQPTHKRDPKNVLIGTPVRVSAERFVADLLIDERVEVLEDHLTGQHITAITLMEAARQTWTAVTEMFFLTPGTPQRFVISSLSSAFHRYVFPLPATVEYELLDRQENAVGQVFTCRVGVYQNDQLAAQVDAEYRVIPEKLSEKQEAMAARQAVVSQLRRTEQVMRKAG